MDQFEPIGHDYVSRNFRDRRLGVQKFKGQEPPYGGNNLPGTGGVKVSKKPKPKLPSNNAFVTALKAGHHK